MTNFLFSTAVRQRSLMFIKVKDIDFDNNVVYVNVTKNRKPLIVPLNQTMVNILSEYLKYRNHKTDDDYLFCNVFGQQLVKSTCYHMLY
jgi:integrase/recombinase XerD